MSQGLNEDTYTGLCTVSYSLRLASLSLYVRAVRLSCAHSFACPGLGARGTAYSTYGTDTMILYYSRRPRDCASAYQLSRIEMVTSSGDRISEWLRSYYLELLV